MNNQSNGLIPSKANLNEIIAQMTLVPFEIIRIQLEAIIFQEFEIARGTCIKHARELDDVYLGHVEKFEGTVRNTRDKFFE
jgi:hypothetical protein